MALPGSVPEFLSQPQWAVLREQFGTGRATKLLKVLPTLSFAHIRKMKLTTHNVVRMLNISLAQVFRSFMLPRLLSWLLMRLENTLLTRICL